MKKIDLFPSGFGYWRSLFHDGDFANYEAVAGSISFWGAVLKTSGISIVGEARRELMHSCTTPSIP
jgi:hypothetical protein